VGAEGTAEKDAKVQAAKVVANLRGGSVNDARPDTEIVALIAYLQRLGTDIKQAPPAGAVAGVDEAVGSGAASGAQP
jgi:cytochrome c oxidase cbb3-type subunit I/II